MEWQVVVERGASREHHGRAYLPTSLWLELSKDRKLTFYSVIEVITNDQVFVAKPFPHSTPHSTFIAIYDAVWTMREASCSDTQKADKQVSAAMVTMGRVGRIWERPSPCKEVTFNISKWIEPSVVEMIKFNFIERIIINDGLINLMRHPFLITCHTSTEGPVKVDSNTIIKIVHPLNSPSEPIYEENLYHSDRLFEELSSLIQQSMSKETSSVTTPTPLSDCLIYGPTGVGKTHLIHSLAQKHSIPLVPRSALDLYDADPDLALKKLSSLFQEAITAAFKGNNPQKYCILFIDEIDNIAGSMAESDPVARTLARKLLVWLDNEKPPFIHFFTATNKFDQLDKKFIDSGTFNIIRQMEPPNIQKRGFILKCLLKEVQLQSDIDAFYIASITAGRLPSDLILIANDLKRKVIGASSEGGKDLIDRIVALHPPSIMRSYQVVLGRREGWDDLGGLGGIREQIQEAVEWPLRYPKQFREMGIDPPRGILLHGPPGCSKTSIARVLASSNNYTFYSLDGATVYSCYVGEAERLIREVFACARWTAPSLIFVDEIDSMVGSREAAGGCADEVQERVLSTFLTEMDGIFECEGVLVLGATNRPHLIDPALLRPGRFDRIIHIPLPCQPDRLDILLKATRKIPASSEIDFQLISEMTEGCSGADLCHLVQQAALIAFRNEQDEVTMENFINALQQNRKILS